MKYSYLWLWLVVLLSACTTVKSLQSVESSIPCLGSVGTVKEGLFSKEFQKVGEPKIAAAVSASLSSKEFTKSTFTDYKKYRESLGKTVSLSYADSLEIKPRYFQLHISDLVSLKSFLNDEANTGLLAYLEDDKNIEMLTGISFVAQMINEQQLKNAQHVHLIQKSNGLSLQVEDGNTTFEINMKELQVFDFSTASFCWQENKRSKPEIAVIAAYGQSCPKGTEKNAAKLDQTKQYLKL